MKQTKLFLTLLMLCGVVWQSWGQTVIDFQTLNDGYSAPQATGSGNTDVFNRVNSGFAGNTGFYWAIEDFSHPSGSSSTLTLDQIDITNSNSFDFAIDMIAHHYNDWDDSDEMVIEYSIDGGAYQVLMSVQATSAPTGSNEPAALDTDFDGTGDCASAIASDQIGTGNDGPCDISASGQNVPSVFTTYNAGTVTLNSNSTLDIRIVFTNITSTDEGIYLDNITITETAASGVANPAAFTATTNSASQIDLAYDDNAAGDNVVIVFDTDNTFTTPTDGNAPAAVGQPFAGGEVLFNGNGSGTYNHTSLTAGTQYFYSAWSVDGSNDYSGGLTDDATTLKAEPTNHVTSFTATAKGSSQIDLSWKDNNGTVAADGFLIVGKTGSASFASPTDGTAISDDTNWGDDEFEVNVNSGVGSYSVTGLDPSTTYDFEIYPYTNSGSNIDYKTGGTVPSENETSGAAPDLIITEVADPDDQFRGRFVEIYNYGNQVIDGTAEQIYFARQANGGNISSTAITQEICPGEVLVIGNSSNIDTHYGSPADIDFGSVNGNGDDGYFLYFGGDENSGTLLDSYGVLGQVGSGEPWEYENSRVTRNNPQSANSNATWTAAEWTITSSQDVADMIPGTIGTRFVYDNGWTQTPVGNSTSIDLIEVQTGNVTISGSVDAHDLSIAARASLTLSSGEYLSLAGSIQNNGTLTIEDDASLVQTQTACTDNNTNNGTYQIYRDQQGNVQDHHRFSYWSSPVSGESMLEVFGNSKTNTAPAHGSGGATNPDDWFFYDEGKASWAGVSPSSSTMDAARGYITTGAAGQTSSFDPSPRVFEEAAVHNGPISFTPQGMSTNPNDQYILVGNPYPSAIDNAQFNAANTGLSGTLYYWNHLTAPTGFNGSGKNNGGDYASWNNTGAAAGNGAKTPNGTVATGQGFFVSVSAGHAIPSSIDFTNDMRVTGNNNQFFKHGKTGNRQRLWLSAQSDSGHFNEILIGLLPQASMDFDRGYDAVKLKGNPHLAFYSVLRNRDLIIQALNQDLKNDKTIPLGLDAGQTGPYTIALDSLDNWPGHSIALLDSAQGTVTNLKQTDYRFAVNQPGAIRGRFYLLISSKPFVGLEEESARSGELLYFQRGASLIVDSRLQNSPLEAVTLRSVSGRTVRKATPGSLRYELSVSELPQGVYLLEARNQAGTTTHHKVYLK